MRWRSELVGEKEKNEVSELAGRSPLAWIGAVRSTVSQLTKEIRQILRSTFGDKREAKSRQQGFRRLIRCFRPWADGRKAGESVGKR